MLGIYQQIESLRDEITDLQEESGLRFLTKTLSYSQPADSVALPIVNILLLIWKTMSGSLAEKNKNTKARPHPTPPPHPTFKPASQSTGLTRIVLGGLAGVVLGVLGTSFKI